MKTTYSLTLAERAATLKQTLVKLRETYRKSSTRLTLQPHDSLLIDARLRAQQQLAVLVPMYRALTALAQQGGAPSEKAKALYLASTTKALKLVDSMVRWADKSEDAYAEILAVPVPANTAELFGDRVQLVTLRERLETHRGELYAKQVEMASLVTRLVDSLTPEQRQLLAKYHELSGGNPLGIGPRELKKSSHG
jgi:hypothetical protein